MSSPLYSVLGISLALALSATLVSASGSDGSPPAASESVCDPLSPTLTVHPPLRALVVDLCRRSPTFRRQLTRLADVECLVVRIAPWPAGRPGSVRASTEIWRRAGLVRSAEVFIRMDDRRSLAELLAHEIEHVLEQLDGVDLGRWAGRSGVHRTGVDGASAIETARAQRVGATVAGEYLRQQPKGGRP